MTAAKTTADAATAPTPLIKTKVDFLPDEVQTLPLDQQLQYYWKTAWQWIDTHTLSIIIAAVIGTLIYLGLNAAKSFGSRYADKHEDQASLTYIALKVIARTSQFFILMVPLKLLSRFAGTPQTIDTIINFLFTVAAVFQVAIWAREIMLRLIRRRISLGNPGDHQTLNNAMGLIKLMITVALFAVAGIVVLDNLGVNVTGLIAGLGIGGIAIGMAAKGIFDDLFAALSIIFDQPFRQGDTIQYDKTTGTVEKIGLKSTRLRATTGEQKIISNTNLLNKEITNLSRLYRRRVQFAFGIVYETSPEKARTVPDICKQVVEGAGHELVRIAFLNFGDSSLDFDLQFDVQSDDLGYVADEKGRVGLMLWEAFGKAGIGFAYPTQTSYTAAPDGTLILPYPPHDAPSALQDSTKRTGDSTN